MAGGSDADADVIHMDCIIIGAGWTGLSVAAALRAYGATRFALLEAGTGVANFWQGNYERIRLHTPWHGLPCDGGLALYRYPMFKSKRQVVQYLQDYFELHRLEAHARFCERVVCAASLGPGEWRVDTEGELGRRRYRCRFLAVCTSRLRVPLAPRIPGQLDFRGRLLHSREYRTGKAFVGEDVLVVGSGNSGAEIAADLVECGAGAVTLLVHGARLFVPLPRLGLMARMGRLLGGLTEEAHYRDWALEFGSEAFWAAVQAKDLKMASMATDLTRHGISIPEMGFSEANIKYGRIGTFDQGAISMIKSGRVAVRRAKLLRLTESSAHFDDDGPPLTLSAIVLATGFQPRLEDFLAEPERFLERGQEGKGCGLACLTPRTDGRCRSSVDGSLFFVGFDQATNGGLAMGFWGWSCGFLIAQGLGLLPPAARFSLEALPERQSEVCRRRGRRTLVVAAAAAAFAAAAAAALSRRRR